MKFAKIAFVFLLLLTACARNLESNSYVSSTLTGVVLEGEIVSARPVTVSDADRLGGNGIGIVGGGITGGVLGSTIGGGKGSAVAAVGGAIIGGVAGAVIQDQLSTSDGMEYIVKVNRQNIGPAEPLKKGDPIPPQQSKTELISIVQGKDKIFTTGQKVYLIYSGDRPRMTLRD